MILSVLFFVLRYYSKYFLFYDVDLQHWEAAYLKKVGVGPLKAPTVGVVKDSEPPGAAGRRAEVGGRNGEGGML